MRDPIMFYSCLLAAICLTCFVGCTLSFTNIDTHGKSTDLVDEKQTASAKASLPVIP